LTNFAVIGRLWPSGIVTVTMPGFDCSATFGSLESWSITSL
jgi:hypothetical protein